MDDAGVDDNNDDNLEQPSSADNDEQLNTADSTEPTGVDGAGVAEHDTEYPSQ